MKEESVYNGIFHNYMSPSRYEKLFETHDFIECAKGKSAILKQIRELKEKGYNVKSCYMATSVRDFHDYYLYYKDKPVQVEDGEWKYKGCFIQKSIHPKLIGKFEVFKDDEGQTHIGRYHTFSEAKKMCESK
jgi:hypothetical protein